MTLSVGKKILMAVHWAFSLLICLALALWVIVPGFVAGIYSTLEAAMGALGVRIFGIALLAVYIGLAVAQFCLIFKRKKRAERGFIIVDSSETGKVRIAVSAIEQMVRQSVRSIDGIAEMKIKIENPDDAVAITVNAVIANGGHVPTITSNMQRSIRQFVEVNCGVNVGSVLISIDSVSSKPEAASRRRFGRVRHGADVVTPAVEPAEPVFDETYEPAQPEPAIVEAEQTPATSDEVQASQPDSGDEGDAPAYDFDKPYESNFAKDLAELRAWQAQEAEKSQDADDQQ